MALVQAAIKFRFKESLFMRQPFRHNLLFAALLVLALSVACNLAFAECGLAYSADHAGEKYRQNR